jgi:glycerate-2-kinase
MTKYKKILNADRLLSHGNAEVKKIALDILDRGLEAADPYNKILKLIRREGNKLFIGDAMFEPYGDPAYGRVEEIDLEKTRRIYLFAWGKGIQRAAKAVEDVLGDRLDGGHIVAKYGDDLIMDMCGVTLAAHPIPDEKCVEGCRIVTELCERLDFKEDDLVISIVGNGVSSLMTVPVDELTISEVRDITKILQIEMGVSTFELNHIRNQVDKLKGGRINRYFGRAKLINIAGCNANLIHGDGVFSRGYGYDGIMKSNRWLHNWPDSSTFADALAILRKWKAENRISPRVLEYLKNPPAGRETMKPDEFNRLNVRMYGFSPSELNPVNICAKRAGELGFDVHVLNKRFDCEAAPSGFLVGNIARLCEREGEPFKTPCVILSTGELLVSVGDSDGVGGRNQEFSLSAALSISGSQNIALAAADTDGTDGPGGFFDEEAGALGVKCLAGGIVDGYTVDRAREHGVDIFEAINSHSSSRALWKLNSGIWAEQNMAIGDIHVTVILGRENDPRAE